MSSSPRNSVDFLLPIKPPAPHLDETLLSILSQTHKDWFLIAVVDGASLPTVRLLEDRIPSQRLRIISSPMTRGIAVSLNDALRESKSEFCARIDADDVCEPDRIEAQLKHMRCSPSMVVLGGSAAIIDATGRIRLWYHALDDCDVGRRLLWRNRIVHSSVLMRRTPILAVGGYNSEAVRREDYELWMRAALTGSVATMSKRLVRYRIVPGQESEMPATTSSIAAVSRARMALAERLGLSRIEARLIDAAWRSAQSPVYRACSPKGSQWSA